MTEPAGTPFRWSVRVYYEDTDAAGVVYYANYLRFFERCRTEWLRALGIEHTALAQSEGRQFVVVQATIDYRRPARLDDDLTIEARITELARSYLVFAQRALRGAEVLATATVKVACLGTESFSPTRLPAVLLERLDAA